VAVMFAVMMNLRVLWWEHWF